MVSILDNGTIDRKIVVTMDTVNEINEIIVKIFSLISLFLDIWKSDKIPDGGIMFKRSMKISINNLDFVGFRRFESRGTKNISPIIADMVIKHENVPANDITENKTNNSGSLSKVCI